MAVIGFDDLAAAEQTELAPTTVHQPVRALGGEMARMLVAALAGREPTPLLLPTRLVRRGSA